jgi:hypothetical protein
VDELSTSVKGRKLWRRLRWILLAVFFAAFAGCLYYLSSPGAQSRWRQSDRGELTVFTEKNAPRAVASAFLKAFPDEGLEWMRGIGLDPGPTDRLPLVVFASWHTYGAVSSSDRLIAPRFRNRPSSELRLMNSLSREFVLDEPVTSSYTLADGSVLFINLDSDYGPAAIHGLSHLLARQRMPRALRDRCDVMKAASYDARTAAAFSFVDETAALFLSDLRLSGVSGRKGGADGVGAAALDAYEKYVASRYAPEGSLFQDKEMRFAFAADPRGPEVFAASARFAAGLARDRGLEALVSWAGTFLRGEYEDLDGLFAPLSGSPKGGLSLLLASYLGSGEIIYGFYK